MPDLMKKEKEIDQKVSKKSLNTTGSLGNYDTNTRQQTSREQTSKTRRVEPNETG